jgi:hypothetical protein
MATNMLQTGESGAKICQYIELSLREIQQLKKQTAESFCCVRQFDAMGTWQTL